MFGSSKRTRISRSALLPYPPSAIYKLVERVEDYPRFLPWCRSVQVHEHNSDEVCASLEIAKGPLSKRLTTRNAMHPFDAIELTLVDGPFQHFWGRWTFTPVASEPDGDEPGGCKVQLEIEFELAGAILRKTLGPVFGEIANTMVGAFCQRAEHVYGSG